MVVLKVTPNCRDLAPTHATTHLLAKMAEPVSQFLRILGLVGRSSAIRLVGRATPLMGSIFHYFSPNGLFINRKILEDS